MTIHVDRDGSIVLTDDADPNRTQTLAAGTSDTDRDAAITAFFAGTPKPKGLTYRRNIIDRLNDVGLLDAAFAALEAQDRYSQERWNSREAIYSDDPTAVALLQSIGADPAAILAPDFREQPAS